ncbi:MAG TPA: metallophosphoesterase [Thermoanaerobaculia bacterium]|jgi:3',5'-cyclic AMP phosphodiesterase CpdA|nr:metallophosphoesterase [Thermoanaerobaculia bacterium]
MRTLLHLSDLHFGRTNPATLGPLLDAAAKLRPHLVLVSGDLTQRARAWQFREARDFLRALPRPQVVVPGNHDVPLYNVALRFLRPLGRYRRYVTEELEPYFRDDEIAVIGINTARSLTFKGGRINERQVSRVRERLCELPDRITRIIVTHHPFDLPEGHAEDDVVGRARMAMETFVACGADVIVSGHLHVSHTAHTAIRYRLPGRSALLVQAGTATSTRERGEPNSFNVLRIDLPRVAVERHIWDGTEFIPAATEKFERIGESWERITPARPADEEPRDVRPAG